MSESLVIRPESRSRVRRSILAFLGLSAPGVAGSVGIELRDPNAFSFSQSIMNLFDGIIAGTMMATEKLDAHGNHKTAQGARVGLALGHIVVAAVGTVTVFERLRSHESASFTSLCVSLGVAALSGAAIVFERQKDKLNNLITTGSDRYHELSRGMARRLFQTKLGESLFTTIGVGAQMATSAEHPTVGIAAIAAAGTFASVTFPMLAQVADEYQNRRELGNIRPTGSVDNLAA